MEGYHAVSCGSQGERILCHNHLRDAIYNIAVSASLGQTQEDRALLPGVEHRPADILIPLWAGGKDCAIDITVVSPFQQQAIQRAAEEPGYALSLRHNHKLRKYSDKCLAKGIQFCPVKVETTGGWHPEAEALLKRAAHGGD